jgi:hypothetical protein
MTFNINCYIVCFWISFDEAHQCMLFLTQCDAQLRSEYITLWIHMVPSVSVWILNLFRPIESFSCNARSASSFMVTVWNLRLASWAEDRRIQVGSPLNMSYSVHVEYLIVAVKATMLKGVCGGIDGIFGWYFWICGVWVVGLDLARIC